MRVHCALVAVVLSAASIFGGSGLAQTSEKKVYQTYLIAENYEQYASMLDGRDPFEIKDIGSLPKVRAQAEPLILKMAVELGGCNCELIISPYSLPTPHARTIEQVRSGAEITHPIAGFSGDPRNDEMLKSDPVLMPEEFFVGFYTHEDRDDILSITDPEKLRDLRYGVGRTWEIDNQVIDAMGVEKVPADNWESLMSLLITRRADVMLQPFASSDDLSFIEGKSNSKFIPIPGVKMAFPQGRQYIVSPNHPDGPELLASINRGIAILRERGLIHEMMVSSGIINESVTEFYEFKP